MKESSVHELKQSHASLQGFFQTTNNIKHAEQILV